MQPNPQKAADLAKFTEEILNGKLHFLNSVESSGIVDCFKKSETKCKLDTVITLEMGTPKLTVKL